ncbi:hypothetical protein [Acinetobacter nosocomialis]|uniref:hypothetical protein n=1 Tax=Acinetobacter nosocomialis TaxID=106654 RepID=UPI0025A0A0D1|nr:hypothetical protein [Acinetobacter nosocomialis]
MSEFKAINLLEEFHDYETASQVLNELEEGESIMTRHGRRLPHRKPHQPAV